MYIYMYMWACVFLGAHASQLRLPKGLLSRGVYTIIYLFIYPSIHPSIYIYLYICIYIYVCVDGRVCFSEHTLVNYDFLKSYYLEVSILTSW